MRRRYTRALPPAPGFSLLEAIVTLVVVAMIVALLMQALSQSLNLRGRLLRHQSASLVSGLQEQWFRESISAAVADLPDAFGGPVGGVDALDLLTARPLGSDGALARVRWSLHPASGADGVSLHYADANLDDLVVVAGPLHEAGFSYLDGDGQWHDEWEPAPGSEIVLPAMVRFRARTATGLLQWFVPISANPRLPQMLRPEDPGSGI